MKVLEENMGKTLQGVNIDNDFWTPKAQVTRAKIDKWNFVKLKFCFTAKKIFKKVKRLPIALEKISVNYI